MGIQLADELEQLNGLQYPLLDSNKIRGGYFQCDTKIEMLSIDDRLKKVGMLCYVKNDEDNINYYSWNGEKWTGSTLLGGMKVYEEDGLPEGATSSYMRITKGTRGAFTDDEDKAEMMSAILALQETVARMKKAFEYNMSCGTFSNNRINQVATGKSYANIEAVLPLYDDLESTDPPEPITVPEVEPDEDESIMKITSLTIKAGNEAEMLANKNYFLPHELLWCKDTFKLYIKLENGKFRLLNGASIDEGGDGDGDGDGDGGIDMSEVNSITFISSNDTKWETFVNDNGEFTIRNLKDYTDPSPTVEQTEAGSSYPDLYKNLYMDRLFINSFYAGGTDTSENSYNPVSHNFIEICNLNKVDIPLNGMSLQYSVQGSLWKVLPLRGTIKAGSTFLVRGAPCSYMDVNTTFIKVKTFDQEWYDNGDLIKFSNTKGKILLVNSPVSCGLEMPYYHVPLGTVAYACKGYCDMIGYNALGATGEGILNSCELNPFVQMTPSRMPYKYFVMDPVKQAVKLIGKRDNSVDWYYIDFAETPHIPNYEDYTPRASYENKLIWFDKTKLNNTPEMVTVTFGRDAHTTRCFNWITKGYQNEYIQYREKGKDEWITKESFSEKDKEDREDRPIKYQHSIYNRIRAISTDGQHYTTHKYILDNLSDLNSPEVQTYEYRVGPLDNMSPIYKFKVRKYVVGKPFSFTHVSDQQGFNWSEYECWRKSAEFIRDVDNPEFTINTGDMTLNGNRLNEWLDYYNAGRTLFTGVESKGGFVKNINPDQSYEYTQAGVEFNGVEQINCIGNNDLCPEDYTALGFGDDPDKKNHINFLLFYCYEYPENLSDHPAVLVGSNRVYIPALYSFTYFNTYFLICNSSMYGRCEDLYGGTTTNTVANLKIKEWCENDILRLKNSPNFNRIKWRIAAVHESPFTILTQKEINAQIAAANPDVTQRTGSNLNIACAGHPFWFSKFLQNNEFRLCLCGHKHTMSLSKPLLEVDDRPMRPIIQVLTDDEVTEFNNGVNFSKFAEIQKVDKITAPVYFMVQATGYKTISNVESPGGLGDSPYSILLPWLHSYFTPDKIAQLRYPFYANFTINDSKIEGSVWKLMNVLTFLNTPAEGEIYRVGGNGSRGEEKIEILL